MLKMLTRITAIAALGAALFAVAPAAADDLEKVKSAGELKIAMSGQYPPFNFVNDKNEVVGFDAAIGAAIAAKMGVKPVFITNDWDGIIAGLRAGKFDTVIGSMTITPERERAVDFVGPYYRTGRGIFVLDSSDIKSIDDLKGKTVGVTLGETHDKWAHERGGWTVNTYKGLPELYLELKSGRVAAIIVDDVPVLIAINKNKEPFRQLKLSDQDDAKVAIGIAIRKNNPQLHDAMQKALDDIMADGTYGKIAEEWVGSDIR